MPIFGKKQEKEGPLKLYLIRHGLSYVNMPNWRPQKEPEGWDAGLTPVGRKQSKALASWMKDSVPEVDAIYASTMKRARETASPVGLAYMADVIFDDRLRELTNNRIDHSALPPNELPTEYNNINPYNRPFFPIAAKTYYAETWSHFRVRVGLFMEDLVNQHKGETILVITHGGVIGAFLDNVLNVGLTRSAMLQTVNTGVVYLEYVGQNDDTPPWIWHGIGWTPHLLGIGADEE